MYCAIYLRGDIFTYNTEWQNEINYLSLLPHNFDTQRNTKKVKKILKILTVINIQQAVKCTQCKCKIIRLFILSHPFCLKYLRCLLHCFQDRLYFLRLGSFLKLMSYSVSMCLLVSDNLLRLMSVAGTSVALGM